MNRRSFFGAVVGALALVKARVAKPEAVIATIAFPDGSRWVFEVGEILPPPLNPLIYGKLSDEGVVKFLRPEVRLIPVGTIERVEKS